ncbi:bifunctional metallophosphatase/5'-nucleotidase [Geodermatophilus marinus]|uniref:bifunctional metallophosphatase/5'-nucleotidase n=1 Tax=Geodermatophilus sp. LHW52908 TaxID=2303986 RepID=UPI000E3B610B|nr:5'-nucleotidase C-terminal domain-containing protein [Geodermatophilus sp. LHW52908]RFU22492.1 bifunctional metallophosphatase/5'-nucleotidase [Geodermatophilus sp. LHW52908]
MSFLLLRRGAVVLTAAGATAAGGLTGTAVAGPPAGTPAAERPDFTLTLLHGNDQESALLPVTGEDGGTYAGAALFTELLQQQRDAAGTGRPAPGQAGKRGVLTVSAGDHFLPGPQLAASDASGGRIYDAVAFTEAGWDVAILGNHDFDRTPDFLGRFLEDIGDGTPFVSDNLGFDEEPALLAQVEDGTIVTAHVERVTGERIGIIGLTTPELPQLTSLGEVTVDPDLAGIANAQAAAYAAEGVDKVVLVSHLQDIDNEVALAADLSGVDVIIGAGGGELLADEGDPLAPDGTEVYDSYPIDALDADGEVVPVVTTPGLYGYVGRLVVTFDAQGELLSIDEEASRPLVVAAQGPDAVEPDETVRTQVEEPVAAAVAALAETVVATTAVPLDGIRAEVRSRETNLGDLVADALLDAGQDQADAAGVAAPVVALQNGGGIRNDSVLEAGDLTALDTFDVLPFANFVAVAPETPIETFVAAVENGLSGDVVDGVLQPAGQFAQVAGFTVTYDPAQEVGSRVVDLTLDDGTVVVAGGDLVADPSATVSLATIDFLLRGGDGYPFEGVDFTVLPVTYQEALENYLVEDLAGTVPAADYPVGGEGRITAVG